MNNPPNPGPEAVRAVNELAAFFGIPPEQAGVSRPTLQDFLATLDLSHAGSRQFMADPVALVDVVLAALSDRTEHTASSIRDDFGKNIEAVRTALDCLAFLGLVKPREVPTGTRYHLVIPPRLTLPSPPPAGQRAVKADSRVRAIPRFPPGSLRQLAQSFPRTVLSLSLEILDPEA